MVQTQRSITRIQDADDVPALGAVEDGKVLVWDQTTSAFIVSQHAKFVYEEGVAGDAVTLIADGDNDVTAILLLMLAVEASDGGVDWAFNALKPTESLVLYTDGTDALTLAVSTGGAVTLQRTAGVTLTFTVTGLITWI